MKRWLVIALTVAGLGLSAGAQTAALSRVKVLKNNCNLRSKALVTSEVVAQVSENDILTAKRIDSEWVEVVPPAKVDLWVLGDYVKDGAVNCRQKVNVRAGAGINFNIVGQLSNGAKVEVRGTHAEWIKIAPPPDCSLWISRALVVDVPANYVEPAQVEQARTETAKPPAPAAPPASAEALPSGSPKADKPLLTPAPTPKVVPPAKPAAEANPPVSAPQPVVPMAPAPVAPTPATPTPAAPMPEPAGGFAPPPGLDLAPTTGQGRWCEVEGILQSRNFFVRSPSDFRLVTIADGQKSSETICFIKGNQAQLKALKYRHLLVSGREYWVKRQQYPVIVPERITLK